MKNAIGVPSVRSSFAIVALTFAIVAYVVGGSLFLAKAMFVFTTGAVPVLRGPVYVSICGLEWRAEQERAVLVAFLIVPLVHSLRLLISRWRARGR
jgi:hypothetical protein